MLVRPRFRAIPISQHLSTIAPKLQFTRIQTVRAMASSAATAPSKAAITSLEKYTACDVSDALLKLKVPSAGFFADLNLYSPLSSLASASGGNSQAPVTVAPVSTVLFTPKDDTSESDGRPESNIPKDAHWVDLAVPGTFAVLKQPAGQTNAVCGGIMALRMKVLGVQGIIVAGRVRDLIELRSTELPVRNFLLYVHLSYFANLATTRFGRMVHPL